MRRRWLACLISLAIALSSGDALAARSSGGYSRPAARTPSFSAPRSYAPRAPSTSGGYARPSFGSAPAAMPSSPGDRSFSRERASQALDARRAQENAAQNAARNAARQPAPPSYRPTYRQSRPNDWFAQQGWQAPSYATAGPRRFGVWDGLFLYFMLDHLTRPGYGDFYRSHQSDPGVQQWRAQAEQQAAGNAELKQKLAELDRQSAGAPSQPSLPPDVPADVAQADDDKWRTPSTAANDNAGPGLGTVAAVVLVGAAGLAFLAWRRRPHAAAAAKGSGPMTPLSTAANLLRHAVSAQPYKPELFRVGMTITADPTPFILAAGATKVPAPGAPGGNMLLSVEAVGRVADGAASLVRLYLPGRQAMFQLHLDAAGVPDECRYFGVIDEVTPADPAEWGAWLDPAEGMIGWPEFQTKDGRVYARIWAPGPQRIAPRSFEETIATAGGSEAVRNQCMLYAAPTNTPAPAPQSEYILVTALQRQGQAWVEIRAGIDVNPAALALA